MHLPSTLHAWQGPAHAPLQQTPSTQNWLKHSAPSAHAAASGFLHAPTLSQTCPPSSSQGVLAAFGVFDGVPSAPQASSVQSRPSTAVHLDADRKLSAEQHEQHQGRERHERGERDEHADRGPAVCQERRP